ncbi:restriction endonuclease subunit S (plasmid) [Halococcus morrhuae DSM 1307]|uniref:restriction endonuclease subunit S n=1 Tax=Halococcus morrhuae TaxID=2250 RepID=UPI0009B5B09B|nr:restriction endonuclease subunit S [Halococcus morrhuae]
MNDEQSIQRTNSSQHSTETDNLHETEFPWLREIPPHWTVSRLKYLRDPFIPIVYGIILPGPDQDEGVPIIKGGDCKTGELNPETLSKTTPEKASEYQRSRLRAGDLVYEIRGSVGRVVKVPPELEGANLTQDTARIAPREDVNEDWLIYALRSEVFRQQMDLHTRGATVQGVNLFDLRRGILPIPPLEEQRAIAEFLDHHTARTDALVTKQKRLLNLFDEKRQSLITQAVTTGLDSTVTTQSTEAQWLAEIPEHWDVVRTRFVARLESGHTPSRSNDEYWEDCNIPWVTTSDIKPFREGQKIHLEDTEYKISQLGLENSGARILPEGTVFVSRTASVGFSGIMADKMATSQDFANWVCGDEIIPEYLLYVFRSMDQEFDRLMQGSTHQTIYMPDIRSFKTPLPPVEEQREIVEHIQNETEQLWNLIDNVERSIDLLEEKRQALITAAVTGQIDVTENRDETHATHR